MKPVREKQAGPLCKFGPGGDFVAVWEPKSSQRLEAPSRLFSAATKALAAAFGLTCADEDVPLSNSYYPDEPLASNTEKLNDAIENSTACDSTDAASAPASANDSPLSAELPLFPDLVRNGLRIRHQSKHRIRASRRAAKKGAAFRIPKQGSLFEAQLARARIA
jgi:hypothetical protein